MVIRSPNRRDALLPTESRQALDWLNFCLAALMTGFGPFVTVYLADRGWAPEDIGLVLTASGLAGLLTQVPAGELIDRVKSKRALVGTATTAVILVVLTYRLWPDFASVFAAASSWAQREASSGRGSPLSAWGSSGTRRSPNGSVAISASPLSAALRRLRSWVLSATSCPPEISFSWPPH